MHPLKLSLFALLLLFSLSGGVSAEEETIFISVNVPMKADYPHIIITDVTNVSEVYWWSMDIALGENFTFTYIADNLVNGTEYAFSYEIVGMRGDTYVNASHLFIANNTEEYSYNLEGQLVTPAYLLGHISSNCSELYAKVGFVKNPNSDNGTQEELATFSTAGSFYPSGYTSEVCYFPSNYPPFFVGPVEYIVGLLVGFVIIVCPTVLVIVFLKGVVTAYRKRARPVDIRYEVNPSSNRYIPTAVREAVSIRDNYCCVKCGSQNDLQFDHIVAVVYGSSTPPSDLQLLCEKCNLKKGVS